MVLADHRAQVQLDHLGVRPQGPQVDPDVADPGPRPLRQREAAVEPELDGWTVIGDRRVELAPVPRLAGTPRVVVRAHALIGDLRLRSLGPGESAGGWRALLDRLAQRPRPPGT